MKAMVALNERGHRIGESHHNAVLTNREVDLLLQMRDQGLTYSELAAKFEIGRSVAARICRGEARHQRPVAWRVVTP